ncbi:uncharacterized protein LOC125939796 [Dermacentor silvarum]|uniref:uncharacterized protein LOC125939796 n=1 Tax=Dermacentor silvarum TaxID=543639 RepID=UPI002101BB2D|nr:uncharacterized protein LOC125939796 [Dermacentor silvarum]
MYYIVEFLNGGGVAAVPKACFREDETLWPPFTNPARSINAFKKCEKPGAGWTAFKCRVMSKAVIGGSCPKDCIRRVMKRCLTDELAETFCLTGRKGKKPFRELALFGVIVAALQKSYPRCTETELHHLIADHLRHAPARCKKRSSTLAQRVDTNEHEASPSLHDQ